MNYAGYPAVPASLRGDRKHAAGPLLTLPETAGGPGRAAADELARFAWLMGQGESQAEVLLLHPLASMQAAYRPARKTAHSHPSHVPTYEAIEQHFARLSRALTDAHIDFDYGDEGLLAQHGSVTHQRVSRSDAALIASSCCRR